LTPRNLGTPDPRVFRSAVEHDALTDGPDGNGPAHRHAQWLGFIARELIVRSPWR